MKSDMYKKIPATRSDFMLRVINPDEEVTEIPYDSREEAQEAIRKMEEYTLEKKKFFGRSYEILEVNHNNYVVPCTWVMRGTVIVEANSVEEAQEKVQALKDMPIGRYVKGSLEIDPDEIKTVKKEITE
jgi:hypothetical protein